jgi:hypothetical protein
MVVTVVAGDGENWPELLFSAGKKETRRGYVIVDGCQEGRRKTYVSAELEEGG